jgi:uncharacterized membrane protein
VNARLVARGGLYAAAYVALTLAPGLNALAYGQVQFRVSEALLPLACVDPAAVPGLTLGTAIGNVASPMGAVDVVYGALLTLAAAALMWRIGPRMVALAVPVAVNGLGVPVELRLLLDVPYLAGVLWVSLGEAAVMATGGLAVLLLVRRQRLGAGGDGATSATSGRSADEN